MVYNEKHRNDVPVLFVSFRRCVAMRTDSRDTDPEIERIQYEMLRKLGPSERMRLMRSLSQDVMQMSWQAIRRANVGATGEEIELRFVAIIYGEEIANRLSGYLVRQDSRAMISKDILEAIRPFVEALEQLNVSYYIGGSVASSVMGKPRSTLDADIVADLRPRDVQPLIELLEKEYYIVDSMIEDAIRHRSSFNIIFLKNAIKIDVFIPKREAFVAAEFQRKRAIRIGEGDYARVYEVASPEDTILRKLDWYKAGGSVSERQWLDVLGILKLNAAALDFAYMKDWAADLGVSNLLEQALTDAGLPTDDIGS
jgi:hypothetical protein